MKKNKTLLVDAQNLLKLSFHGNQTTYTKNFGYIGCVVTFYTILRRIIKEQQANKVILFWDGEHSGKLRYQIYPEYKSNRGKDWNSIGIILSDKDINREENSEKSLMVQRERIKKYAEELFIRQYEDPICEADDCIAYYCNNLVADDELAIIVSNDQDFCQLVSDNVYLYILSKKSIVSPNNYYLFFDHHHKNSGLIKAIEGCKTDVIHGVDKMGETTLLKLFPELRQMPVTFEHLYNRAIEINKERVASKKKPLVTLTNLIEGKTSVAIENVSTGKHLFEINHKLVNLKEPIMTEDAIEAVEAYGTYPISDKDRGGKNLLRLMFEDGFITTIPGGADGYKNFLVEFLPVVNQEKRLYANYLSGL